MYKIKKKVYIYQRLFIEFTEMPKKPKAAPKDYYDMKDSVDKSKKIKHSEVFGKGTGKKGKVPKGSHRMPDGSIMKDSDMPKKTKKKNTKKKSSY